MTGLTGESRAYRVTPEPLTDYTAASQRYAIVIGGTRVRTISDAAAETTFRRWSRSPDVLLRGDLRTGFVWLWADKRNRIAIVPERDRATGEYPDSSAVPADADADHSQHGLVMA